MKSVTKEYPKNRQLYQLLKRISSRDIRAVEQLFKDYSNFIYWSIMDCTDDKDLGEDILQEVLIKLYGLSMHNLPKIGAKGWLAQVSKNTAKSYIKKNYDRGIYYQIEKNQTILDDLSIDTKLEEHILNSIYVHEIISKIDRISQKILLMHHLGFTFEEISVRLNVNASTTRSKYFRALKKLQMIGEKERNN